MPQQLSELSLRSIWEQQKFDLRDLRTTAGVPVFVITPGTPNDDAGPDFRDATIRVGRTTYCGDVEIHLDASSWNTHRHTSDPRYNRVILHVVLTARASHISMTTSSKRTVPCLALEKHIDPALLSDEHRIVHSISCAMVCPASAKGTTRLTPFLEERALERLEHKRAKYAARLQQIVDEDAATGGRDSTVWRQLFYEAIVEGMGFSKNREAFLRLARVLRLRDLETLGLQNTNCVMAAMFHAAGLLPSPRLLPDRSSRQYVRLLRKLSRQLPPRLRQAHLHETDWLFFRLRPRNFPTARLAAVVYLLPTLFAESTLDQIFDIFRTQDLPDCARRLRPFFQCTPDEYWQHHVHFRGEKSTVGLAFGAARVRDLIVNAIMPIALLRAHITGDTLLRKGVLASYAKLSSLQENSITRMTRTRLAPNKQLDKRAMIQQGLLQVHNEWCVRGRCEECTKDI